MKSLYYAAGAALAHVQRRRPLGRPIWATDWDLCIVLDSMRVDLMTSALAQLPDADRGVFPAGRPPTAWSVGSITTEWLTSTFHERYSEQLWDLAYVTATPHSETVLGDGEWLTNQSATSILYPDNPAVGYNKVGRVREVWRTHADAHGAVPPEIMADATLETVRDTDHARVLTHWLQPHEPWIADDAVIRGGAATETNVWDGLGAGDVDPDAAWQSYTATARDALQQVARVVRAVDGTVLVTADHGNAFGEWGIYGHPFGWPQPAVRKVPWVTLGGHGQGIPAHVGLDESDGADRDAQLAALGYR